MALIKKNQQQTAGAFSHKVFLSKTVEDVQSSQHTNDHAIFSTHHLALLADTHTRTRTPTRTRTHKAQTAQPGRP